MRLPISGLRGFSSLTSRAYNHRPLCSVNGLFLSQSTWYSSRCSTIYCSSTLSKASLNLFFPSCLIHWVHDWQQWRCSRRGIVSKTELSPLFWVFYIWLKFQNRASAMGFSLRILTSSHEGFGLTPCLSANAFCRASLLLNSENWATCSFCHSLEGAYPSGAGVNPES